MATATLSNNVRDEALRFSRSIHPAPVRSMREFAEQEIIVPTGPFKGRGFRCSRQPYSGLWFDAIDSGLWQRHVATGPSQSGKTLSCFVIPTLYHLFEDAEDVICGLPDMALAHHKWEKDLLPAIQRSRYANLVPISGTGSRGGKFEQITFLNGATLLFMSGGGGDKSRASVTTRILVITETDGLDVIAATSRESDKISQLEARTNAFPDTRRIYMECTVSTDDGRTWVEYENGTHSRILLPCALCGARVQPEREHLLGWQNSDNEIDAKEAAFFACPECGGAWSDEQRIEANRQAVLLHDGQEIGPDGVIHGEPKKTRTFGFRWSGVNNLFYSSGTLAIEEWGAAHSDDEEAAERRQRQFVWCIPVESETTEDVPVDADMIMRKVSTWPRGVVPTDSIQLTAAIDLGKYLCHWVVIAWESAARGHIVDYGRLEVASEELGLENALRLVLREWRDMCVEGWPVGSADSEDRRSPQESWVDAGYQGDEHVVYEFAKAQRRPFRAVVGRGAEQQRVQAYHRPKQTGALVKFIGQGYHIAWLPSEKVRLVETDADHWKTWSHTRMITPEGTPGAMTLFQAAPTEHLAFAKHVTAERKQTEFVKGKGVVTKWIRLRKQNHWLDAYYMACCAGWHAGVRLSPKPHRPGIPSGGSSPQSSPKPRRLLTPV